jgi:hypothetical protein
MFAASDALTDPLAIISYRRKNTSPAAIAIVWYAVANCIIARTPSKPLLKLNTCPSRLADGTKKEGRSPLFLAG